MRISLDEVRRWQTEGRQSDWSEPPSFDYLPKFPLTLSKLKERPDIHRVLDIGCFTGYLLRHLAGSGYECTGVDVQKELMGRLGSEGNPRYYFCPGEKVGDKFPGYFDVVLMMDSLEHALDAELMLSQAEKALRPGGWVFINLPRGEDPNNLDGEHLRCFTDDEIMRVFGNKKSFQVELCKDEYGEDTSYITYQV